VAAVLNVTPDSFSDGGRFEGEARTAEAAAAGIAAADAGAVVVDVGGESTRPRGASYGPGAVDVPEEDELLRVVPVLAALRAARPSLVLSVDTRKHGVARAALDAGADVLNAVSGLDLAPETLELVAERGAALVLNHMRGDPSSTFAVSRFSDVVAEVAADLDAARERALRAGIPADRILLDPGLGFGKTPDECRALLAALDLLDAPGRPLVVGASRKAFLVPAGAAPPPPAARLPESLAAVAAARAAAPRRPILFRVHDAAETVRFLAALSQGPFPSARAPRA
jgi:dihydropteroate synthase